MKVLILEDHELMRFAVASIVTDAVPDAEIFEAVRFADAIQELKTQKYALIIMDIGVDGGGNVGMVQTCKEIQPEVRILISTGFSESLYAIPFIKAGADGFITKQAPMDELTSAIRLVLSGKKYISESIALKALTARDDTSPAALSAQELNVMHLMMEGKYTKEIAFLLKIKENTVSTYKARIYEKMDVRDFLELSKKFHAMSHP